MLSVRYDHQKKRQASSSTKGMVKYTPSSWNRPVFWLCFVTLDGGLLANHLQYIEPWKYWEQTPNLNWYMTSAAKKCIILEEWKETASDQTCSVFGGEASSSSLTMIMPMIDRMQYWQWEPNRTEWTWTNIAGRTLIIIMTMPAANMSHTSGTQQTIPE